MIEDFYESDEILERPIKPFGNSAHIAIPGKHIGKIAKVIIKKNSYISNQKPMMALELDNLKKEDIIKNKKYDGKM